MIDCMQCIHGCAVGVTRAYLQFAIAQQPCRSRMSHIFMMPFYDCIPFNHQPRSSRSPAKPEAAIDATAAAEVAPECKELTFEAGPGLTCTHGKTQSTANAGVEGCTQERRAASTLAL